jgi:hypothetical protein
MSRLGPGGDTRAYIWPRSWRKLETLAAPIRPECAFDPKAILGSHACDQSLPGLPGGHLLLCERIAISSTPSNPRASQPRTVSGLTISNG